MDTYTVGDPGEFLSALSSASVDLILVLDGEGHVVYSNRSARPFMICNPGAAEGGDKAYRIDPALVPPEALAGAATNGLWMGESVLPSGQRLPTVFFVRVVAIHPDGGSAWHFGVVAHDVSKEHARERELQSRNAELEVAYTKLKGAQEQLIQSEKLASIGQLAAGVAHEINNPIGYVHSNLGTLNEYTRHLLALVEAYDLALGRSGNEHGIAEIADLRRRFDIDFVASDLPQLLAESREGIERVRKIVQDLKDFSRSEAGDAWVMADVHRGLDSTLNIVWNELKYKAQVVKSFGELPLIECVPSELNQVFMNILVNAGQALRGRGIITVSTGREDDHVWIAIGDDGEGIHEDVMPRIFDPFFTTKPVGSGTGLGLAISYGIIRKHSGNIHVTSTPGQGTMFRIELPVRQPRVVP